jgi:hypothetical protein
MYGHSSFTQCSLMMIRDHTTLEYSTYKVLSLRNYTNAHNNLRYSLSLCVCHLSVILSVCVCVCVCVCGDVTNVKKSETAVEKYYTTNVSTQKSCYFRIQLLDIFICLYTIGSMYLMDQYCAVPPSSIDYNLRLNKWIHKRSRPACRAEG